MTQLQFKHLQMKRAFEEISDEIKNLIYSGELKPGDRLPSERELANQFGSGRMVVREAMRMLEQSGFVYIKKGSEGGAIIKDSDSSVVSRSLSDMIRLGNISLDHLTETRLALEMTILEYVVDRLTEERAIALKENIDFTEKLIAQRTMSREGNISFHLLLAKSANNPLLEILVESIMEVVLYFLKKFTPDIEYSKKVLSYHMQIYDALLSKDIVAAKSAMKEHLLDVNLKLSTLVRS